MFQPGEADEVVNLLKNYKRDKAKRPDDVGMSQERLGRIRIAMQRYVDKKLVPGVVTLVARNGKVVHLDAVGQRYPEAGTPMQTDTVFRIASMTKPITSVALMMLYEEGHFLLSDPVSKWIPEFADPKVAVRLPPDELRSETYNLAGTPIKLIPANRPITIRHLLTHTAGFGRQPRGISLPEFAKVNERQSPNETIGDFVKRYAKVPLNHHPGEAWDYSRATCVVGHLVEIISGMTLDEFFRERIFKPLNMTDTHFFLPAEKLDRFAACYTPDKDLSIKLMDAPTPESRFVKEPHTYFMGSGGLVSTARDYFRFYQALLNGGQLDGARIIGRKTIELMTANHTGDLPLWLPGPWSGFGLGFAIVKNTDHVNTLMSLHQGPSTWSLGSYSWGGAFCTYAWVDPKEKVIGIVMTQVSPYTHLNIRQEFVGLAYQALVD
ncbi:MAG: serine hydrolase domain-containing protein [Dehalococcoidia bacterium]|nr:serine hydrolase domain-containing protein [Dehalococcoidia bacterium]